MTQESTIVYGAGEIIPHIKGGWAIPGGGRTMSKVKALALAMEIDRLCGGETDDSYGVSITDDACG